MHVRVCCTVRSNIPELKVDTHTHTRARGWNGDFTKLLLEFITNLMQNFYLFNNNITS
jgi:hypothetical protein